MSNRLRLDPARLPALSRSMAKAGYTSRCACASCASCVDSTARMLRGLSRVARPNGFYDSARFGRRYAIFSRLLGPNRVDLLADTQAHSMPTVVDVRIDPDGGGGPDDGRMADRMADAGTEGEITSIRQQLRQLPAELARMPLGLDTAIDSLFAQVRRSVAERREGGPNWRYMGSWRDKATGGGKQLVQVAGKHPELTMAGLYCMQWIRRDPASGEEKLRRYLGMTSHRGMLWRLAEHASKLKTRAEIESCVFWVWPMAKPVADPIRIAEHAFLSSIIQGVAGQRLRDRFNTKNWENSEPELEV